MTQNRPMQVIHDSCSEGVCAVFTKKQGDRVHVRNKVANIIRGLGYLMIVIKSDQEPTIRSMEWNVVEHSESCVVAKCCDATFASWRGQQSTESSSTRFSECARTGQSHQLGLEDEHQSQAQPITNDMAVADRVC